MKVVIDISKREYNDIEPFLNGEKIKGGFNLFKILEIIKNGTPLPKGHGRLIDANAFIAKMEDASKRQKYKKVLIDDCLTVDDVFKAIIESLQNEDGNTPTIIEADNVESENITNLCDQCSNVRCIFQSGIVRSHCDFYKGETDGK